MCRCCEVCAFVKDEVCGGRGGIFGACDQGLKCKKVNTLVPGIGIYETTWKCAEDGEYSAGTSVSYQSGTCLPSGSPFSAEIPEQGLRFR